MSPLDGCPATSALRGERPKNYGLFGTFDVENFGDQLFPLVTEWALRQRDGGARLRLYSPFPGLDAWSGARIHGLTELAATGRDLDGFIFGGGDIVRFDRAHGHTGEISYEDLLVLPTLASAVLGRGFAWNAPGVSFELASAEAATLTDLLRLTDYVSVREVCSRQRIASFLGDGQACHVVPDPAFLIGDMIPRAVLAERARCLCERYRIPDNYIVAHLSPATGHDHDIPAAADALRRLSRRAGCPILTLALGPVHGESSMLARMRRLDPSRFPEPPPQLSPRDMLALLAHASAYIGTSLHGGITAFAYHVPATIINSRNLIKVAGFAAWTGRPTPASWTDLDDTTDVLRNRHDAISRKEDLIARLGKHFDRMTEVLQRPKAMSDSRALLSLTAKRWTELRIAQAKARFVDTLGHLRESNARGEARIAELEADLLQCRFQMAKRVENLEAELQAARDAMALERDCLGWRLLQALRGLRDRVTPRGSWRWHLQRLAAAPFRKLFHPSAPRA